MDIRPPARPPVQPSVQPPYPQQYPPQIQPVPRPPSQPVQPAVSEPVPPVLPLPQPNNQPPVKKSNKKKLIVGIILGILGLGIFAVAGIWFSYQAQLEPVDNGNNDKVRVKIEESSTPSEIASVLKEKSVVRSEDAFLWYTRVEGVQSQLKAGSYRLSPSESTPEIVEHLVKGNVDTFSITFYPGATLVDTVTNEENRIDVTSVLKNAGYNQQEITAALNKSYDHPLFVGKPATANLEGFVFGETYEVFSGATAEEVLTKTFDEFYKYIEQENLVEEYQRQGLTIFEGITLASIIQRESGGDDKPQIARVFYNRLAIDMALGSDVTYQYIADKEGGVRDPNYDSPYNTRRYPGLPPGPIAVPGLKSLQAVAAPVESDYLFFLSGDDNVTYYARTLEEHEANIRNHCQEKCQII